MTAEELVARLVRFGRTLRLAGLEVGPGRLQNAVSALLTLNLTERDDVYWALRCTLCSHHDHLEAFDARFEAFWHEDVSVGLNEPLSEAKEGSAAESADATRTRARAPAQVNDLAHADTDDDGAIERGRGASSTERLLTLDFREYGKAELLAACRLMDRIAGSLPNRRSFRSEPARAPGRLDVRRTFHQAMRTDGETIERAWRRPRSVPRQTVFLLDISGSMAAYARPVMMFAQSAVGAGRAVEAFTFGTRLTRVTAELGDPRHDRALAAAAATVPDWSGGTRIGASLESFLTAWTPRGVGRGAVVVIVSDGWERDDPQPLGRAMARLHRLSHAVVWVNPLAGDADYAPLAAGMAAALPHIDVFLPGHDLSALVSLASALEQLPDRRRSPRPWAQAVRPAALGRR